MHENPISLVGVTIGGIVGTFVGGAILVVASLSGVGGDRTRDLPLPSAPAVTCPAGWEEVGRGVLQEVGLGYVTCDHKPYNLTLTEDGAILTKAWGPDIGRIEDPVVFTCIIERFVPCGE